MVNVTCKELLLCHDIFFEIRARPFQLNFIQDPGRRFAIIIITITTYSVSIFLNNYLRHTIKYICIYLLLIWL